MAGFSGVMDAILLLHLLTGKSPQVCNKKATDNPAHWNQNPLVSSLSRNEKFAQLLRRINNLMPIDPCIPVRDSTRLAVNSCCLYNIPCRSTKPLCKIPPDPPLDCVVHVCQIYIGNTNLMPSTDAHDLLIISLMM